MSDLSFKNVWFSYDRDHVLEDVSFEIEHGDFAAMVGPNGGGKTTIVRLMLGLEKADKGTVSLFGGDPVRSRRRIGYVPQFGSMDYDFPIIVKDVVSMGQIKPLDLFPGFSRKREEASMKAMDMVGIKDLAQKQFSQLSGGQKQRCLIARAIVSSPDVLILDEPTASIDHSVEQDIYELLKVFNSKMTVVIVTHDISFVSAYANKIICVNVKSATHLTEEISIGDIATDAYPGKIKAIEHRCGI